ncbi:ubiquitin-like protein ATG12 isoform 2-T2 [Geothlypis trichas]
MRIALIMVGRRRAPASPDELSCAVFRSLPPAAQPGPALGPVLAERAQHVTGGARPLPAGRLAPHGTLLARHVTGRTASHEGQNVSRSRGRPSGGVTSRRPRRSGIMAEPEEQPLPAAAQSGGRSDGGEEAPEGGTAAGTAEPGPPPAGSPATEEPAGDAKKKIDVLLKAVGDTPIMRTKKWAVERTRTIQGLVDFIKKFLKLMASEQLFIYVNQSFAPSPDQEVGTLYECFGSDGKLVLHYCKTQAWG